MVNEQQKCTAHESAPAKKEGDYAVCFIHYTIHCVIADSVWIIKVCAVLERVTVDNIGIVSM